MSETKYRRASAGYWHAVSPSGAWIFRLPFWERRRGPHVPEEDDRGTWRVRFRNLVTGERGCRTVGVGNEVPAKDDLARAQALVERMADRADNPVQQELDTIKTVPIGDAFDRWLANIEHEVRLPTYEDYTKDVRVIRRYLAARGLVNVADVSLGHLEDFFRTCAVTSAEKGKGAEKKAPKVWSGRTKVKYLAVCKRLFAWCVDHHYTAESPAEKIKVQKSWSKAVAQSRHRGVALSMEQARALLVACREKFGSRCKPSPEHKRAAQAPWVQETKPPAYLYPATLFALRTGCRLRNVIGLRWKHLTNDMTELRIDGAEMKAGEPFHAPLHGEVIAMLKGRLDAHLAAHKRAPSPDALVFGPEAASIVKPFARALKRAKLLEIDGRRVRWHDLRHTAASWFERHCTFAAVQRLMGHAPQSMTHRYVHLNIDELREELDRLPWLEPKGAVAEEASQG